MASLRVRAAAAAVVVSALASACGGSAEPDQAAATAVSTPPPATVAPGAVETREPVLRLAGLPVEGGTTFDPDSVAGLNVLVWFWGPH